MTPFFMRKREALLGALMRAIVGRYGPGILVVTGETSRDLALAAISAVMRGFRHVRVAESGIPQDIALPLAILGGRKRGTGFLFWIGVLWEGACAAFLETAYPELLMLECPAKRTDDAGRFLGVVKPQITLVTASGDERAYKAAPLVEALPSNGYGIVNGDSRGAKSLIRYTRAHVTSFGFDRECDMRIGEYAVRTSAAGGNRKLLGISFMLEYAGKKTSVMIDDAFGREVAYAAASAACVGIAFGQNLPRIADSLRYFRMPVSALPQEEI